MALVLASIPPSIAGMISAYFSYKASIHAQENLVTSKEIKENTNGLTAHLVALTQKSSYAEGKLEGEKGALKDPKKIP